MTIDITEEQAFRRAMNDEAEIGVGADGVEVFIFSLFERVKWEAGMGGIQL